MIIKYLSIKDALSRAVSRLTAVSPTAKMDADILLCHTLKKDRTYIFTWPETALSDEALTEFESLVERRLHAEPIAYIVGHKEFWSIDFKVTKDVLIPRPETELLVETVLKKLLRLNHADVADLGTGSGAIACAIAVEKPNWSIVAVDNSAAALNIARENAARYKLENIKFYLGDWCEPLDMLKFDAIVSNPPYIEAADIHLKQGDVRFEPRNALVADQQGLADIQTIIEQAIIRLKPAAYLLLEHGYQQGLAVQALMHKAGYQQTETLQDLNGLERITIGQSR